MDPAQRQRILLGSDCYVPRLGGIEVQAHALATHLVAAGHDVEVVTPSPGPDRVDGIRVHRIDEPLLPPFDIPWTRNTFRKTRRLLEHGGFDVAHFHGGVISPFAFVGAYVAQDAGVPAVVTSHCVWNRSAHVFRALDRAFHWSEWPIVISAVSELAASEIRLAAGPGSEVLVIPNGIDVEQWRVEPAVRDDDTVVFMSVMRLARRKRPGALVRMVHEVKRRVPDASFRVCIVGEGMQRPRLVREIARLGLRREVELCGRLEHDRIKAAYAAADVYVAPAELESFGLAALEARCAGLPVLAQAQTGIREFVEHGREGLLAASDRQMVDHMVRMIREPELRAKITAHNRDTRPQTWDDVLVLNLDAYRRAEALRAFSRP